LHPDHDTPVNSIIFYAVVCLVLSISGSFVWLAVVSSLSRLIVYVACMLSIPVIRRKMSPEVLAQAKRVPGGFAVPAIAIIFCIWAASHSTLDAWLTLGTLAFVGMFLYWLGSISRR